MSGRSSVERWLYYGVRLSLRLTLGRRRRDLILKRLGRHMRPVPSMFPAVIWPMIDWEPDVSRVLKQVKGEMFVDVGCNVGYFVHLLKNNFRRIIAFEADPQIAKEAQKHAPANAKIYHLAVSDRSGFVYVNRNPQNLASGASMIAGDSHAGIRVPCCRLSDYIPKDCAVDLVKVDVEGAEWHVLKGAEPVMPQVRRWMIELHDPNREKELDSYLKEQCGYKTCWLKDGVSMPHVFATSGE